MRRTMLVAVLLQSALAGAEPAQVLDASAVWHPEGWRFSVTLQHADSGWKHYADGWRVVDEKGVVLGHRVLYHPHVEEQPFTRSLDGVLIPEAARRVFIQAHDTRSGWADQRFEFPLPQSATLPGE